MPSVVTIVCEADSLRFDTSPHFWWSCKHSQTFQWTWVSHPELAWAVSGDEPKAGKDRRSFTCSRHRVVV